MPNPYNKPFDPVEAPSKKKGRLPGDKSAKGASFKEAKSEKVGPENIEFVKTEEVLPGPMNDADRKLELMKNRRQR